MKARFRVAEFDAFQFEKHQFSELPTWAQTYSVKHGADTAKLYRHATLSRLHVPGPSGHHLAVDPGGWLVWNGQDIFIFTEAEFSKQFEIIPPPMMTEDIDYV